MTTLTPRPDEHPDSKAAPSDSSSAAALEIDVRRLIAEHFAASTDDMVGAAAIYADDAVLEFPQEGERIRGRDHIIAFRSALGFVSCSVLTERLVMARQRRPASVRPASAAVPTSSVPRPDLQIGADRQ